MKPYRVIEILSKPYPMSMRLDHIHLKYYGVTVNLQYEDDIHETMITFESEVEACNLKIGDVFCR